MLEKSITLFEEWFTLVNGANSAPMISFRSQAFCFSSQVLSLVPPHDTLPLPSQKKKTNKQTNKQPKKEKQNKQNKNQTACLTTLLGIPQHPLGPMPSFGASYSSKTAELLSAPSPRAWFYDWDSISDWKWLR